MNSTSTAPPYRSTAERLLFYPSPLKPSSHSDHYPDSRGIAGGFVLYSPAKVNLSLRILGKRPDNYHELETVFQELDWADEIQFEASEEYSLEIEGADLPIGEKNLITRAARALAAASGVTCTGRLRLSKCIPVQAGLGGGSSNAAITLLGLNRLWGLNWPISRLQAIASSIGADCPFFLRGGLTMGRGRGDMVEPWSGSVKGTFVLILPDFGVETAWAFSEVMFPLTEVEKNVIFNPLQFTEEGVAYPRVLPCNDLENIVFRRYPALKMLRDRLLQLGADVSLMSGSGSTILGIFLSDEKAVEAAAQLSLDRAVRVKVCRAVARKR